MWRRVRDRLDRRWKRIAFVCWLPLVASTIVILGYAAINIYKVKFADDGFVLGCHQRIVRGPPITMSDTFQLSDDQKTKLAYERFNSRFSFNSPASSEASRVERDPSFMACMANTPTGSYWLNYPFVWSLIFGVIFWNALIALIILPRFWRGMGSWIMMKS